MALFRISFGPWVLELFPVQPWQYVQHYLFSFYPLQVSYLWRRDT